MVLLSVVSSTMNPLVSISNCPGCLLKDPFRLYDSYYLDCAWVRGAFENRTTTAMYL
jgi:hypothetical protein